MIFQFRLCALQRSVTNSSGCPVTRDECVLTFTEAADYSMWEESDRYYTLIVDLSSVKQYLLLLMSHT